MNNSEKFRQFPEVKQKSFKETNTDGKGRSKKRRKKQKPKTKPRQQKYQSTHYSFSGFKLNHGMYWNEHKKFSNTRAYQHIHFYIGNAGLYLICQNVQPSLRNWLYVLIKISMHSVKSTARDDLKGRFYLLFMETSKSTEDSSQRYDHTNIFNQNYLMGLQQFLILVLLCFQIHSEATSSGS